jgi:hypothetical protein
MTKQFLTEIATPAVYTGNVYSGALSADGAAGTYRTFGFTTAGVQRWALNADASPETGAAAGSSLVLACFDDTGTWIGNALSCSRATGVVGFPQSPTVPTVTAGDSSNNAASTAFVAAALAGVAYGTKAAGNAILDFGSAPGGTDAQIVITGQAAITHGASLVDARLSPDTTPDHSPDEHWAEDLIVTAGDITTGTGFVIYGKSPSGTYGKFNVGWVWV